MKQPPVPRHRIYDLYWYFASERQQVFERRVRGECRPWTSDPIIGTFKFCNTYRAADRVSQYLIHRVAYDDEQCSAEDRLFQILAFRTFSRIKTWEAVRQFLGHQPSLNDLASGRFTKSLEFAKESTKRLYTAAFILCATNAYGPSLKYLNHVELFRHMFLRNSIGGRLLAARSLRDIYEVLHGYPLMGDFMSYQLAIDLNYSNLFDFSENEFTQPGPGALRGIRKVFHNLGDYTPTEIILWMVDRQEQEFAQRGLRFQGLWGRPLHAIDCQGLFCETDKYCREAAPELTSTRKRIKCRFSASTDPIRFFFPPKWGINEKLGKDWRLGGVLGSPQLERAHF
jgi:hypothetical protein